MRISDWSSDVCSSDLPAERLGTDGEQVHAAARGLAEKVRPRAEAIPQRPRILRQVAALQKGLQMAEYRAFGRPQPLRHVAEAKFLLGGHQLFENIEGEMHRLHAATITSYVRHIGSRDRKSVV